MSKLAIIKIGKEITGVFVSPQDIHEIDIIDFSKNLAPWENKVLELIEQSKLVKIA